MPAELSIVRSKIVKNMKKIKGFRYFAPEAFVFILNAVTNRVSPAVS
jgi:hypothetical protein